MTILLILVFPRGADAQVNAEALRSTLKKNPRFVWIEGSLVGRTGNTQTMTFGGSIFGGVTKEPHLFFTRLSADYGEARAATNVSRWLVHARYNYRLTGVLSLEALAQAQHDRFRRIQIRDLYGLGVRFHIYEDTSYDLFAGTTYLFEHEGVAPAVGSPGEKNFFNRSSSYFGVNAKLAEFADASTVTYIQPRLDRPKDFRVLSESFVVFTITKLLAARISGSLWFDSEPPIAVKTYDVEVKNSLVLKID